MTIFVCKDEFDSILCGVYDAWMSGLGHENVRLITRTEQQNQTMQMFAEYREAEEASWKIKKDSRGNTKKDFTGGLCVDLQSVSQQGNRQSG